MLNMLRQFIKIDKYVILTYIVDNTHLLTEFPNAILIGLRVDTG